MRSRKIHSGKKIFSGRKIIAMLIAVALLLPGCAGRSGGDAGELFLFNWGDYLCEDVLRDFQRETGIRVHVDFYPSNELMYSKIVQGGSQYDMAIPSDYMIERMINEDMLYPLNFDNIPNIRYIDERLMNLEFDPTNEFSVPYMWGTVGILYNTTMVHEPVTSFSILWDERFENQIFMYDSVRDSLGITLKMLGYSLNTTNPDEINRARDKLIEQVPLVLAYADDIIKDHMAAGQGALAVVYSGDAMFATRLNPDLAFSIPLEGSNRWVDSMVILRGAQNKENAEKLINFLSSPEIAARNSEFIGYTTAVRDAVPLLPLEMTQSPIFWATDEEFERLEPFRDLGPEVKRMYEDAWTQVLILH